MKPRATHRKPLRDRIYRLLLRLYPADVRERDGQDMLDLFNDLCEAEHRQRGWLGVALVSLRSYCEIPVRAWGARTVRGNDGAKRQISGPMLGTFLQDFRFGVRILRKSPAVVIVTIVSLAFGVGAVTTVYSVVNGLLFHPPVGLADPQGLVTLYTSGDGGNLYGGTSFPDYLDITEEIDALEDAAAFGIRGFTLDGESESETILAEEVTGNFFAVTGIQTTLGRGLLPEETEIGGVHRVAVISHDLWIRRFGRASDVLGETLRLNGESFMVVGVAPEGVVSRRVPVRPDAWVPIGTPGARSERRTEALADRNIRPFLVLGRLREDATLDQVQAQISVLSERLHGEYAEIWTDEQDQARILTAVEERHSRINPRARPLLAGIAVFFLGAAGLILLIACSNVATLFLARAGRRRQEMAIRLSIGATRRQLVGLLLVEGLIPGLAGGGLGVFLASVALSRIESISIPLNIPINLDVSIDLRVLLFALVVSLAATLLFGLVPALNASKPTLSPSLKGDVRRIGRPAKGKGRLRPNLQNMMVVVQCAASLVLIVGAALFLRTLQGATTMDLGFNPEGVAVMTRSLPQFEDSPENGIQYFRDLRDRLSALPGVTHAELSRALELTLFQSDNEIRVVVPGSDAGLDDPPRVLRNSVTPGYLEMLQIPLLRGRLLRETDGPDAPLVAVVNETFAHRFWPGQDPVGRQFRVPVTTDPGSAESAEGRSVTVVGMVEDGKYEDFDDGPIPYFWTPLYQDYSPLVAVSLKGTGPAETMVPLLHEFVELDPGEVPLVSPTTLESQVAVQFIHLRIATTVLGWGGAFGLILAAIGIYGIVSVAVTERTREMAIRVALGADRNQVVRRVAGGGLMLSVAGLATGLAIVLPLAHLLRSVLYGVGAIDPLALGGGIGVLVLSALFASVIPAKRVTRMDPMKILREE